MEAGLNGLPKREQELKARGLTAMIKASNPAVETCPEVFPRLAEAGHAIGGGFPRVCWDVSYEEQYAANEAAKSQIEELTGQPMQAFSCTYFSYDENTIRAAEALGGAIRSGPREGGRARPRLRRRPRCACETRIMLPGCLATLDRYRAQVAQSEGLAETCEYFPIIFIGDRAFSGFDAGIRATIEVEIAE